MGKTREKKTVYTGLTAEQAEDAFADYAKADARLQKINAEMDIKFTEIREKYAVELGALTERKNNAFDIMQSYATANKDSLFAKKKSLETAHGIFGFRIGTPKLKTQKGFTWGAVLQLLKSFLPEYVRVSEEPAKDKLLADRNNEEMPELFNKVGIAVVQEETFFVEPKKEEAA